jgi:holo-[acyl-carrier protein] synthase
MGADLVHLPRIENLYHKYGSRFLDKVLTPQEKQFCLTPVSLKIKVARIGGRIAAKEAVVKTLGIGISTMGNPKGVLWPHVEIAREDRHAPRIKLHDKAAEVARSMGIDEWLISLTHDGDYAVAIVIGVKRDTPFALPSAPEQPPLV